MVNAIQLRLFQFFFVAFLPPQSNNSGHKNSNRDNDDFYALLSIRKNDPPEKIRKAYIKKSLQYHPDKIALDQNKSNHSNSEELFLKIKDAYETLSDPKKRRVYDILGNDGVRMFHGTSSTAVSFDPQTLLYNLANASFMHKTRLFILVLLLLGILISAPVLICMKVDDDNDYRGLTDISWFVILVPIWFLDFCILTLMAYIRASFLVFAKMICILVLQLFLALKWDGSTSHWRYAIVLIPLFVHQFLNFVESISTIRSARYNIRRMVTVDYLEKIILPNGQFGENDIKVEDDFVQTPKLYSDLEEDEKELLNKQYIIIQTPHEMSEEEQQYFIKSNGIIDEELKLLFAISTSPEYKKLSSICSNAFSNFFSLILFRAPFLALLVIKLDENKNWNWFLVFLPIWVELTWVALISCCRCCFYSPNDLSNANTNFSQEGNANDDNDAEVGFLQELKKEGGDFATMNLPGNNGHDTDDFTKAFQGSLQEYTNGNTSFNSSDGIIDPEERQMNDPFGKVRLEAKKFQDEHDNKHEDEMDMDSHELEQSGAAIGVCCIQVCLSIILVLFLVKLNAADNTNIEKNGGFNAFWVMFPIFLVSGIILCCCCCVIYSGLNKNSLGGRMKKNDNSSNGGDVVNDTQGESTTGDIKDKAESDNVKDSFVPSDDISMSMRNCADGVANSLSSNLGDNVDTQTSFQCENDLD